LNERKKVDVLLNETKRNGVSVVKFPSRSVFLNLTMGQRGFRVVTELGQKDEHTLEYSYQDI